jgi:polar amino acid transport system permease protein
MNYVFQFSVIGNNLPLFIQGIFLTIQMSALSIILGLLVGIIGALFRTSENRFLNMIAITYVELIRNTPFLVQLFFFFFGLPAIGLKLNSGQAAVLALFVNFGAYATEIIRTGVESIKKGQIEASQSLGLNDLQTFRYVVLMPALANIYPSLIGQIILIVLGTSVVSQVSAEELTFVGSFIESRTFRSFEIYFTITLIYLVLVWAIKLIAFFIERKYFKFSKYY